MADATRTDVYTALAKKAGFVVLQEKETERRLRIMGRCTSDRWPFFAPVLSSLIDAADREDSLWSLDPSKLYMKKESKLVYGWRLVFEMRRGNPNRIENAYGVIRSVILSAALPARVEVDTVLLPGHKAGQIRGGVNARGKGASSAGAAPMILTRGR